MEPSEQSPSIPPTPSKRRRHRWPIVALVLVLVIGFGVIWFWRPRFDQRLVGTWVVGRRGMTIADDGLVSGFFVKYQDGIFSGFHQWPDQLQARVRGDQFKLVEAQPNLNGIQKRIALLIQSIGGKPEVVLFSGRIEQVKANELTIQVDRLGSCTYQRARSNSDDPIETWTTLGEDVPVRISE